MKVKTHYHPLIMIYAKRALVEKEGSSLFFSLTNLDPKVIYSASRPKKFRNFIQAESFMKSWQVHNDVFLENAPEVAICYDNMPKAKDNIFHAIPIDISSPSQKNGEWIFKLQAGGILEGVYSNVALFIDWLPSVNCPMPIQVVLPNMV